MTDIRKQLGLDFLNKRPASSAGAEGVRRESDRFLQDALLVFAPRVMHFLAGAPDRTATVFQLVDVLGEPVRVLSPVIESLRENGYVDVLAQDPKGDDRIRLTDRGAKVAAKV